MKMKKLNEVMDINPWTSDAEIDTHLSWGEKEFKIEVPGDKDLRPYKWYNMNNWTDGIYYVSNKEQEKKIDLVIFFVDHDVYEVYEKTYEYGEVNGSCFYEDPFDPDEEKIYLSELDPADEKSFQDIIKNIFEFRLNIENKTLSKIR